MKPNIPAGNAIIATLYLLITIAFFYVVKLVYKSNHKKGKTSPKYTNANLNKGLTSPLMQNHIQPTKMLIKAYALKYSVIGTFLNLNKCYMLKQIFILSIISIACSSINSITVYPIAFAIVFSIIFFVTMQVAKLPFYWNISTQIDEQRKIINNQVASQQIQIQPGLVVNSNNNYQSYNQPAKQENTINNQYSYKYSMYVAVISFITLILISQTMFTIYNSISNLGALNLGSVVIVVVIDQLGIRPIFGLLLLAAQKIINHLAQNQEDRTLNSQQLQNEARSSNKLKIFQFNLFKNLCQDLLIARMNQLYQQHGEPSNYSMGASPTKKKTFSPSKVPKAQPDQQTLMNLNVTKNLEEALQIEKIVQQVVEQNVQEQKSPIKQIQMSMIKQSMLFTSIEKQMFGEDNQNDQLQCNKTTNVQLQKIKINPNQYFSVQRLPKDQLNHQQHIQDDGLVLIEAGLNLVKQKQMKQKPNTIDIDFSPTKKRKKTVGAYPKRRQLIITGSSPYLEYLPDMMKKQKQNKKNLTPSSHQQISTISRKVL